MNLARESQAAGTDETLNLNDLDLITLTRKTISIRDLRTVHIARQPDGRKSVAAKQLLTTVIAAAAIIVPLVPRLESAFAKATLLVLILIICIGLSMYIRRRKQSACYQIRAIHGGRPVVLFQTESVVALDHAVRSLRPELADWQVANVARPTTSATRESDAVDLGRPTAMANYARSMRFLIATASAIVVVVAVTSITTNNWNLQAQKTAQPTVTPYNTTPIFVSPTQSGIKHVGDDGGLDSMTWIMIIVGGLLVALGIGAIVLLLVRRNNEDEDEDKEGDGDGTELEAAQRLNRGSDLTKQ